MKIKRLLEKPHLIFWLSIPLVIGIGFFFSGNEPLDINLHDTYYIIERGVISQVLAVIFGIIGLGYWIMQKANRQLSKLLSLIHIALTFGGLLIIWILFRLYREPEPETFLTDYDFNEYLNIITFTISLLVVFGQIVFPINIIRGIIIKPL